MATETHLYFFEPECPPDQYNIARREIHWLVKDALGSPTPGMQKGFAFSASQVETHEREALGRRLAQLGTADLRVLDALGISVGVSSLFLVPVDRSVDLGPALERLSLSGKVIHLALGDGHPTAENLRSEPSFWAHPGTRLLPFGQGASPLERGLLNVNHPYHAGSALCLNSGAIVEMEFGSLLRKSDENYPLLTVTWSVDPEMTEDEIRGQLRLLRELVPPGTKLKGEPRPTNQMSIPTGALSAGSLLVRTGSDSEKVPVLVREADAVGLSLHQLTHLNDRWYLGFKKHPRHPVTNELGPSFEPMREVRRLAAVEWARNEVSGHRGPGGLAQQTVAEFDGWAVTVRRPGFKDADDFMVVVRAPSQTEEVFDVTNPVFDVVFAEAAWNLHCPNSGRAWLDAVWRLWNADVEPLHFIEDVHRILPPCSFATNLRYPRGAFLWMLNLLFIEEDINYRFLYHKLRYGPSYRKQGRDMPMNVILTIAATPFNEERPGSVGGRLVSKGELIGRPSTFAGPEHLRRWFEDHVFSSQP